jgi:erythromycin esterase-like protein
MVIFCLTFGRGEFHAISHDRGTGRLGRLGIHEASPAPRESYEWYLRKARMPRLILDLRGASEDSPATTWLTRPHGLRSIGALYDPNVAPEEYFRDVRLAEEFDAVIYFEETTPSVPLSLALLRWSRIG